MLVTLNPLFNLENPENPESFLVTPMNRESFGAAISKIPHEEPGLPCAQVGTCIINDLHHEKCKCFQFARGRFPKVCAGLYSFYETV